MTRSEEFAEKELKRMNIYWPGKDGHVSVPYEQMKAYLASSFLEGALSVIREMEIKKEPCMADFPGVTAP